MRRRIIELLTLMAPVCFYSCANVAPVTNQYEKAATLKRGNIELAGNFTAYTIAGYGGTNSVNNNYGFRAGYGLSDKVDIKLRYERLKPSGTIEDSPESVRYFSIIPKIALVPNKLSLLIPISYYSSDVEKTADYGVYDFNSIAPQIIYTITNKKNTADLSFGLKADCLFAEGGGGVLFGATIGGGFSSDLEKWAIRPEVGLLSFGGGASFLSYGVGLQFILPKKSR